jgi:glycogen operon protein
MPSTDSGSSLRLEPGQPHPLGARQQDTGCNFAVFSPQAKQIQLCLFDEQDQAMGGELLLHRTGEIWHGFIPDLPAGTRYGFRASGEFNPDRGALFNPKKLLLDPYAVAISAPFEPSRSHYAHDASDLTCLKPCPMDSASSVPKGLTPKSDDFDWQETLAPQTPWSDTVIYEAHVKGFSQLNPDVPEHLRGTYLGFAHEASIAHLRSLGVTAVQLMPCFAFMSEPRLAQLKLTNYWGYNPVSFFAPDPRYAIDDAVTEFKTLVRSLHQAGIEVIMDVVYNHTAEADLLGPCLSQKGLHGLWFYRHKQDEFSHFIDNTGCGNSVSLHEGITLQLVMDSLRHWLQHYRVDGFRFDLAAALGREEWDFSSRSAFFMACNQDPVIRHSKLIAEPWDIGRGGYQLGNFPVSWYECNDRFRDTLRRFWRSDMGVLPEFANVLMGSRDVLNKSAHSSSTSLNYVTYHDGFTLHDLVSYNDRHNSANQERNMDGHGNNLSYNWGVEGPSDDDSVLQLRGQTKRNLIATVLLSQGAVHLLGGDELNRTQQGNNNAYCQDNDISWLNWDDKDGHFQRFMKQCIDIRQSSTLFRNLVFEAPTLSDAPVTTDAVHWFRNDGYAMEIRDWQDAHTRCLGILLSTDIRNPAINLHQCEEYYLVMLNNGGHACTFTLPANPHSGWKVEFDTARNNGLKPEQTERIKRDYELKPHSMVLLSRCDPYA